MNPRRMLVGIAIGAGAGLVTNLAGGGAPWIAWVTANVAVPVGQIFLRFLFMLVVPLLFSALVVGIVNLDVRALGRLGVKMLVFTVTVSFVAIVIGLLLVNALAPGAGPAAETLRALARVQKGLAPAPAPHMGSAITFIVAMVPDNPVKAAASGDMIAVIVFSLVFGIALSVTRTPAAGRLLEVVQGLYDLMMTCIEGVLRFAPIGVGALLFSMAAHLGLSLLRPLGAYVSVVLLGLGLHFFVVYSLLLRLVGHMSPITFFRGARLAIATAFSTASSSATLPTALKVAEKDLALPPHVSRFVLTIGSTMNQNGTALFEGVTVLFLAQLYGVHMPAGQQAIVMLISVLGGVGTAGVPAGSLPVVAMILGLFGIPPEGLALILGVDRFLDMCRTTLNVTGDLVAAVCLSRLEAGLSLTEPPASEE